MMARIFEGDVGTIIRLDTGTDLSSATVMKIEYTKPGGSTGEWLAQRDPNDVNAMFYKTLSGDLDQSGTWALRAYVELPDWKGHGEEVRMMVGAL